MDTDQKTGQKFVATKNPTPTMTAEIIRSSPTQTARRITDPSTGDVWVWDATLGTHAEGAKHLGVFYDRKPGEGDILVL
jgi:hypothetical protein